MDGNYSGTLDLRLAAADTFIHLDFSTIVCAWRVGSSNIDGLGQKRGHELRDGCPERLDWPFLRFVLNYRQDYRTRNMERMAAFDGAVHRFSSPGTLDNFLSALAGGS